MKDYYEVTYGINSTLADIVRSLMIILGVFQQKGRGWGGGEDVLFITDHVLEMEGKSVTKSTVHRKPESRRKCRRLKRTWRRTVKANLFILFLWLIRLLRTTLRRKKRWRLYILPQYHAKLAQPIAYKKSHIVKYEIFNVTRAWDKENIWVQASTRTL